MIVVIKPEELKLDYVNFLETRQNIIMEGTFTKIIYSTDNIVMNGIYLLIPFNEYIYDKSYSRIALKNNKNNKECIDFITDYEHYILSYFKHINNCKKTQQCLLKEQLNSFSFKIYKENNTDNTDNNYIKGDIVLKISGIWENKTDFGLTYKILETFHVL